MVEVIRRQASAYAFISIQSLRPITHSGSKRCIYRAKRHSQSVLMLNTAAEDSAISSLAHHALEFPADGRTPLDFHRSIVSYLDWRAERGRSYSRSRNTPSHHEYGAAKHLVISVFWAKEPHPMMVVGSVSQNDLPACVSAWPEALRLQHEMEQAAAAAQVAAATKSVI